MILTPELINEYLVDVLLELADARKIILDLRPDFGADPDQEDCDCPEHRAILWLKARGLEPEQ